MTPNRIDPRYYNVCLDIAGLYNRGDWMMYTAMLEQVRRQLPNAVVYVPAAAYVKAPTVYQKDMVLPLVDPASIDLVLNERGFAYSDHFGVKTDEFLEEEEWYYSAFTKPGRKLVLMPQAFGPFQMPSSRRRIQNLMKHVDLVYARDKASYDYLTEVVGPDSRISITPDLTCLYDGEPVALPYEAHTYVVFIPNKQMIRHGTEESAAKYREFCEKCIAALLDHGESVVLLNHEGPEDRELMDAFNAKTGGRCKIVDDGLSGGGCKTVIGGAKLVVTSRYHGLISSLCQGIPVLCTSWAHKYEVLVEEMGVPESLLDLTDVDKAVSTVLRALESPQPITTSPATRDAWCHAVTELWQRVFSFVPTWASSSHPLSKDIYPVFNSSAQMADLKAKLEKAWADNKALKESATARQSELKAKLEKAWADNKALKDASATRQTELKEKLEKAWTDHRAAVERQNELKEKLEKSWADAKAYKEKASGWQADSKAKLEKAWSEASDLRKKDRAVNALLKQIEDTLS